MRALLFMLALALTGAACTTPPDDPIPHVRLGMAPRDVRERFEPGAAGTWRTSLGSGDDTAIEWTASGPSKFRTVRFEFHLGMLVAIRAETTEPRTAESVSTTAKTVTARSPAPGGGSTIAVLARDCPTHKDEAEALAQRAKK